MYWKTTNNQQHTIERFELLDGASPEMILRYNPIQHSGRLERKNNHLLFFMEESGIWGSKYLFENEYGVEIGKIVFDHLQNLDGHIQMDKKKIHFKIPVSGDGDIYFSANKFLREPFQARIAGDEALPGTDNKVTPAQSERYACMILGLFWYLFPEAIPEANKSGVSLALR